MNREERIAARTEAFTARLDEAWSEEARRAALLARRRHSKLRPLSGEEHEAAMALHREAARGQTLLPGEPGSRPLKAPERSVPLYLGTKVTREKAGLRVEHHRGVSTSADDISHVREFSDGWHTHEVAYNAKDEPIGHGREKQGMTDYTMDAAKARELHEKGMRAHTRGEVRMERMEVFTPKKKKKLSEAWGPEARAAALLARRRKPHAPEPSGPGERPGLEGPFNYRSGWTGYYDPKEGRYYDHTRDMHMPRDFDPHTGEGAHPKPKGYKAGDVVEKLEGGKGTKVHGVVTDPGRAGRPVVQWGGESHPDRSYEDVRPHRPPKRRRKVVEAEREQRVALREELFNEILGEAWSPQARAAALAARKRHAHGLHPDVKFGHSMWGHEHEGFEHQVLGARNVGYGGVGLPSGTAREYSQLGHVRSSVDEKRHEAIPWGEKKSLGTFSSRNEAANALHAHRHKKRWS